MNESYFCVRHKNRQKHNYHFKTAVFYIKFTLRHVKPNIYWKKLNLLLTSSIYVSFFPLEMQKWFEHTKIYHTFSYFVWKETTHKALQVSAAKTLFSSVYVVGITCFDECFLFYVIIGKHYFSWKFVITLRFF